MPNPRKTLLREEEWNFEELLKRCNSQEVHFCYLYEFGREALDYDWLLAKSKLSLGEVAMFHKAPNALTERFVFYTHYFHFGQLQEGIWLKVPYFDLPAQFRTMIASFEKERLSRLIDARWRANRGPFQVIKLAIPLRASHAYISACFAAFLEVNFPTPDIAKAQEDDLLPKQGGKALIRQWKTALRSLGAFRLLKGMSIEQAMVVTKRVLQRPLYNNPPSWSAAKKWARQVMESFEADLLPARKLLSAAPKGVTQLSIDSGSGKLEYR
jgi:hypothetical protein